jgi:hypothetical protein
LKGSKSDLPKTMEMEGATIREAEWGDIHVEYGTFDKEFDVAPMLKGLPDDRCQTPHWGYVIKGTITVNYKDHLEIINAGDSYYMEPGHTGVIGAGTEYVEFSPKDKYKLTLEVIMRNMEAMQK